MAVRTAEYLAPAELSQALEMLSGGTHTVLAGGTDFYPARVGKPLTDSVIDVTGIGELRGISQSGEVRRFGALTTWSELINAELPPSYDGLKLAASQVGGVQIQNAGTIGGNLCNASPAADGIPPLLTLDASVELASASGTRVLPLEEFLVGYRETALQPGELLSAVLVPTELDGAASDFLKLGARKYLVISIVMVAAVIAFDDEGTVEQARVAIGACSPVAQRARSLEADLAGKQGNLADLVNAEHLAMLAPIDDIRASGADRLEAAFQLVRRAIGNCAP